MASQPDEGRSVRRLLALDPRCHWCQHAVVSVLQYRALPAEERGTVRIGTRDHVHARSRGGRGGANIVLACVDCNMARGDGTRLGAHWSPPAVNLDTPLLVLPSTAPRAPRARVPFASPRRSPGWTPFFIDTPRYIGLMQAPRNWRKCCHEFAKVRALGVIEAAVYVADLVRNRDFRVGGGGDLSDSGNFGVTPQYTGMTLAEWARIKKIDLYTFPESTTESTEDTPTCQ